MTTAATARVLFAHSCTTRRDRSSPHRPPARLQTLAEPPARATLPFRANLLGIRHAGDRQPRRAARRLAGAAAHRPLPSTESGRTRPGPRSEEHTSELQSLMRISYAVFCLKKKKKQTRAKQKHEKSKQPILTEYYQLKQKIISVITM